MYVSTLKLKTDISREPKLHDDRIRQDLETHGLEVQEKEMLPTVDPPIHRLKASRSLDSRSFKKRLLCLMPRALSPRMVSDAWGLHPPPDTSVDSRKDLSFNSCDSWSLGPTLAPRKTNQTRVWQMAISSNTKREGLAAGWMAGNFCAAVMEFLLPRYPVCGVRLPTSAFHC